MGSPLEGDKVEIWDGGVNKYNAAINLRAFYIELHDLLFDKGFRDTHCMGPDEKGVRNFPKAGTLTDNKKYLNRTGDMFENHFVVINKGDAKEYEMKWKCTRKVPDSEFGNVTFELDLSVRNCKDKEILDGNNKKVLQNGGWEFRNKLYYENTVMKDYIDKIPIISNINWLKMPFAGMMYGAQIDRDIAFVAGKFGVSIKAVIEKHFLPGK